MVDTTPVLSALAAAILAEAQARIPGGPAGRAAASIRVESVSATHLTIVATAPASYLIHGWGRAPMAWLAGKTVAFTPRGSSTKIVRRVTQKSLAAGHWVRPARAPDDVLSAAWQAPQTQMLAESLVAALGGTNSGGWAAVRHAAPDILPQIL